MKQRIQGTIAGFLAGALCMGGAVWAKSATETIEVTYDNIKVYKDNVLCELKDTNGNTIEPFIYNGTTYLPVRGAANLADMQVTWEGATKSVYLWDERKPEDASMFESVEPYETGTCEIYRADDGKSFTMGGTKYSDGLRFSFRSDFGSGYALFNLNGKYSEITFDLGSIDGYTASATLECYLDGKLVKEFEVKSDELPKKISLPVNYALQLKLAIKGFSQHLGLGNMKIQ